MHALDLRLFSISHSLSVPSADPVRNNWLFLGWNARHEMAATCPLRGRGGRKGGGGQLGGGGGAAGGRTCDEGGWSTDSVLRRSRM